jgi:hypothetical protein
MANTALNRTTTLQLKNKSGINVEQGDIVVIDNSEDNSFTITSVEGYTDSTIGVVLEPIGIFNNEIGAIAIAGWVPKINLDGIIDRTNYIKTSSTSTQGTLASNTDAGIFAQLLETGSTPSALIITVSGRTATVITANVDEVIYHNTLVSDQDLDITIPSGYDFLEADLLVRTDFPNQNGVLKVYLNNDTLEDNYQNLETYLGAGDYFASTYYEGANNYIVTMGATQPSGLYSYINVKFPNPSTNHIYKHIIIDSHYLDLVGSYDMEQEINHTLWSGSSFINHVGFHGETSSLLASGTIIRLSGRRTRDILISQ